MQEMHQVNYHDVIEYLSCRYEELDGYDFYKELFPNCENVGAYHYDFSQPNAVYLYESDRDTGKKKRRIMLVDSWEADFIEYVALNRGTLCGGLTYRGRMNRLKHAQQMNALVIDLDGVGFDEVRNLFLRFTVGRDNPFVCPLPTFLVASGDGLHIYYVFDQPIDLFPNIKLQMKALKYALTFKLWDYTVTSQYEKIQYQSINQGFRMVGSINDKYNTVLRAFRVGERITLEDLNSYVKEESRVDITMRFRPSKMSRKQAKEQFPEWYQRVIVEGNKRQKKWNIAGQKGHNGDEIYNWWLNRVEEVKGGHRYFFMMCLVIYACKCDIPMKRLREDLEMVFQKLSRVNHKNALEQKDVDSALEAYSREYYNFKIEDIEKLTDLPIIRNARNGRKQKEHLQAEYWQNEKGRPEVNTCKHNREFALQFMRKNGEIKGRPVKKQIIKEWRENHSDGKKSDCVRDTGLSKPTVYKWWNE